MPLLNTNICFNVFPLESNLPDEKNIFMALMTHFHRLSEKMKAPSGKNRSETITAHNLSFACKRVNTTHKHDGGGRWYPLNQTYAQQYNECHKFYARLENWKQTKPIVEEDPRSFL